MPVNGQQTTDNRRPSGVMLLTVTTEEAMPENGKAMLDNGQQTTDNGGPSGVMGRGTLKLRDEG